jgi:hypothetical protein
MYVSNGRFKNVLGRFFANFLVTLRATHGPNCFLTTYQRKATHFRGEPFFSQFDFSPPFALKINESRLVQFWKTGEGC